ncbi:hypothetical protein JCM3766R1_000725 [Sporobolomyces carnicolor]
MQPSRLPPITSTRPEEWTYLAEGGANVVLTLGPSSSPNDSPFSDKVVRLRKRRKGAAVPGQSGPLGGDADVDFHLSIIQPLLSDVVQLETLAVTREWLEGIDRVLNQRASRPRVRLETDAIDLDSHSVVVAQDLVSPLRGEIAFEIKPKWGFLPSSRYLASSTRSVKTMYCRFCMHRYYRTRSIVEHETGYCPLDLYSGDRARVRKAARALVASWESTAGETNNLRVFRKGVKLSPSLDRVSPFSFSREAKIKIDLVETLVASIESSRLLSNLSSLQARFDPLDIEGLASLISSKLDIDLADATLEPEDLARLVGGQPTIEEWKEFLSRIEPNPSSSSSIPSSRPPIALDESSVRDQVISYLLSATLKDCSIMINVNDTSSRGDDVGTTTTTTRSSSSPSRRSRFDLTAIDLDPKPVSSLAKWYKLDHDIVETWREMLETLEDDDARANLRKCCSDGDVNFEGSA